jgi:hypothetical protein
VLQGESSEALPMGPVIPGSGGFGGDLGGSGSGISTWAEADPGADDDLGFDAAEAARRRPANLDAAVRRALANPGGMGPGGSGSGYSGGGGGGGGSGGSGVTVRTVDQAAVLRGAEGDRERRRLADEQIAEQATLAGVSVDPARISERSRGKNQIMTLVAQAKRQEMEQLRKRHYKD